MRCEDTRVQAAAHLGPKDFKCDTCGKVFSHARNLKVHVQTVHQGQKDFKCDTCGKAFGHASHLKRHMQADHQHREAPSATRVAKRAMQAAVVQAAQTVEALSQQQEALREAGDL